MPKTTAFKGALLDLEFKNTDYTGLGDAGGIRGSASAGSYYVSLAATYPGASASQNTSELSYTGYARQAVVRSGSGWSRSGNNLDNAAIIAFGKRTDSGAVQTARFWIIGHSSSGAGTANRYGHIGGAPLIFTATTADTLTIPGHTMAVNDEVCLIGFTGASLPTGTTEGTVYFIKTVSGNDVTLSATQGGATLDITAAGAGYACPISAVSVGLNNNPQFAAGALDFFDD